MAKRVSKKATAAEGPTRPVVQTVEDVAGMKASGMVSDQWNAAVRLQCAVRDRMHRPVSMTQALNFVRQFVLMSTSATDQFWTVCGRQFDEEQRAVASTQAAKDRAIRETAGRS